MPPTSLSRGLGLMMAAAASFAAMALCVSAAHRVQADLSTLTVSAVRAAVNLVVLGVLVRGDLRALVGDGRLSLWMRGVLGTVALLSHFGALAVLGAGEAAFLNQTSAAWVALLAPVLLKEPTRGWVWAAVLGSLVGMGLLLAPREAMVDPGFGRALGLLSGFTAAGAYLSIRVAAASNRSETIVFWFTWMAFVVALLGALATGAPWPRGLWPWAFAVGTGVFATLGQVFMTEAYRVAPAAPMAAASAASPLMTAVLAAALLEQVPDAQGVAGMAVLFASAVALPLLQVRRTPPASPPGTAEAAFAEEPPVTDR